MDPNSSLRSFSPGELVLEEVQIPSARDTVTIDGRHYRVLGDDAKIRQLLQKIPQQEVSSKSFDVALLDVGMQDMASAKASSVGSHTIIRSLTEKEAAAVIEMNALLEGEVRDHNFRGAVLVVHSGKPILMKGYGVANAAGDPITEKTVFHLASVSKQFTAVAIMKLLEQGKIDSLNDKISKYLPPRYAENPLWKDITIHQLLTHTSGVPNLRPPDTGVPYRYSSDEVIATFKDLPLDFEPGTHWNYSNSGYDLLGKIIENVSGVTFEAFMQREIFDPLEMRSTVAGPSSDIEHCATGFDRVFEEGDAVVQEVPYQASHLSLAYAAGNILSTIEDMRKWDAALHTEALLKKEHRDMLFQAEEKYEFFPEDAEWKVDQLSLPRLFKEGESFKEPKVNYGYGWDVYNVPEAGRIVEHTGGIPGFCTVILRRPEAKDCIVVLSNIDDQTKEGGHSLHPLANKLDVQLFGISGTGGLS